ncbi:serine protease FAM111A-like [Oreochromis aureus]|uniref:serine protease FAM111A-like n=1 Tax=Oreochromis aureus TaxID=47969 RepID=UPI0019533A6B|nr:serine protease FAM111A-like [Oreochromis aureus]
MRNAGLHTKTKELFKNNDVKQFKNLCVYGEKGITVAEALKRDGRFIDDLGNFELSNNQDPKRLTVCTQKVEKLHQKQFKIRLPKDKKEHNGKPQESPSNNSQSKCERRSGSEIVYLAQQEGIRVKTAVKETSSDADTNKIYELLREQFPDLKRWMESRFPGDLYQEALNLRKENFGKIQQSFSEVHRVRKLLELGKSVCKVSVKDVSMGTGFVLFDTFILTSAHFFDGYVEGNELQQDVEVFAIFDYEKSEPETNLYYFRAENTFIDLDAELDYAVLELNPEGSKPNQQTRAQKIKSRSRPMLSTDREGGWQPSLLKWRAEQGDDLKVQTGSQRCRLESSYSLAEVSDTARSDKRVNPRHVVSTPESTGSWLGRARVHAPQGSPAGAWGAQGQNPEFQEQSEERKRSSPSC